MKENILNDAKKGCGDTTISSNETTDPTIKSGNETTSPTTNLSNETTSSTDNSSNETTSVTNTTTTRSNDTYVYGDGIIAVLAIGVCVFFAYDTFQPEKLINEKKISHNDFMSIKTYIINEYFNWKKSTEDSLKDGLIMTATTA